MINECVYNRCKLKCQNEAHHRAKYASIAFRRRKMRQEEDKKEKGKSDKINWEALKKAEESLHRVKEALENQIPGDLVAMDIRNAIYHLGEITGAITSDDLLGNIFSKFCIGK